MDKWIWFPVFRSCLHFLAQIKQVFSTDNPWKSRVDFLQINLLSPITFYSKCSLELHLRWIGYQWNFQNAISEGHALTAELQVLLMIIFSWGKTLSENFEGDVAVIFPLIALWSWQISHIFKNLVRAESWHRGNMKDWYWKVDLNY